MTLADCASGRVSGGMSNEALVNKTCIVVGATRGLGRGVARALAEAGAKVVAVGRSAQPLQALQAEVSDGIEAAVGDATDEAFVNDAVERHKPDVIVMVAGAAPLMKPLSDYDWEALSQPWNVDVQAGFRWIQAALRRPLRPGSRVVVFSSGAALHGSPLSGGYAGAKHTQRFLTKYAAGEAKERDLGVGFQAILPQLNPNTDLGRAGIKAYAAKAGEDPDAFVRKRFGDTPLSPQAAGAAIVELLSEPRHRDTAEFVLTGGGLRPIE